MGNDVTFICTFRVLLSDGPGYVIPNALWRRNGVIVDTSTPGHTLLPTECGSIITGLMVTNTTLDGNSTGCTKDTPDNFTSSVVLKSAGGIIHTAIYHISMYVRMYYAPMYKDSHSLKTQGKLFQIAHL